MQGTIEAMTAEQIENLVQEVGELELGHLSGCHFEILVLDRSQAGGVAGNLHVLGRICENHVCTSALQQYRVAATHERVSAVDAVPPKLP